MIHRSTRKRCSLGIFTVVSAFAATTALTSPASAMEGIIPFLPGVSVGVPVGALPPPGFYFSQAYTVFDLELRDNRGRATGIKISDLALAPQVSWVPDIKILGATYGAFVAQPLRRAGVDVGGPSLRNFEAINTVISPINSSGSPGEGFFASAGLVVYTGAWTYSLNDPDNAGRDYWTIEPNFGLRVRPISHAARPSLRTRIMTAAA